MQHTSSHIFRESDSHSTKGNIKSMKTHFNNFYKNYYKPDPANCHKKRPDLTLDNINTYEVTDELLGHFASYLSTAHKNCNEKLAVLAYVTVSQYFSTLKTVLLKKFTDVNPPPCLADQKWRMYATNIRRIKIQQCIKSNKPLFGEYDKATDEDTQALSALVFWDGSVDNAEFLSLYMACMSNCGRGSEVCFIKLCIADLA